LDFNLLDVRNLVETFDPWLPTGDPFLDARFDAQVAKFGNPNSYWRMFYRLCELLKPDLAVELGAWQGTCAAHMASGGAATVATIDHHTDPGDDLNEALTREAAQNYANLFYFKGWTWDRWEDVRDLGKRIDLLFIDSWHQLEYALKDWYTYKPLLADRALVVCDDLLETDGAVIAGMREFWVEVSSGRPSFVSARPHPGFPMGFFTWTR